MVVASMAEDGEILEVMGRVVSGDGEFKFSGQFR
jgi:hypothetical protein